MKLQEKRPRRPFIKKAEIVLSRGSSKIVPNKHKQGDKWQNTGLRGMKQKLNWKISDHFGTLARGFILFLSITPLMAVPGEVIKPSQALEIQACGLDLFALKVV